MARNKLKLAFLTKDSTRKTTFNKRKKTLIKKVNKLSTLCGIDACAIIYSPYDPQPEIWPNNVDIYHVLAKFKCVPEMEQTKKMVNQETFFMERIAKTNEQLKKTIMANREKEITEVMYRCLTGKGSIADLILPDLNDLGVVVDRTMNDNGKRIESLRKEIKPCDQGAMNGVQGTQWFVDWDNHGQNHGCEMARFGENPNVI